MRMGIFSMFLIMIFLFGCSSSPDREVFKSNECYSAFAFIYKTRRFSRKRDRDIIKIGDKLMESCIDSMKYDHRIQKLEYCRDKLPTDMTERECRLWFNVK